MARINTNVSSLIARTNLARTGQELDLRLERLSTGLRINRGKDDPAGLIASENLRAEIGATNAAITNAERADQVDVAARVFDSNRALRREGPQLRSPLPLGAIEDTAIVRVVAERVDLVRAAVAGGAVAAPRHAVAGAGPGDGGGSRPRHQRGARTRSGWRHQHVARSGPRPQNAAHGRASASDCFPDRRRGEFRGGNAGADPGKARRGAAFHGWHRLRPQRLFHDPRGGGRARRACLYRCECCDHQSG